MSQTSYALIPLSDFDRPVAPAPNRLRSVLSRLKNKLEIGEEAAVSVVPEKTERLENAPFDDAIWDTLRHRCHAALDDAYARWLAGADSPHRVCACLMLPSVPKKVITDWVGLNKLVPWDGETDEPRGFLTLNDTIRRTMPGVAELRETCAAMARQKGRVLIFATTVQWSYLCACADFDQLATDQRILPPYPASLLGDLIADHSGDAPIRSRRSGKDILHHNGDDFSDGTLPTLAAQVFGCPWAALDMMAGEMTQSPEEADDQFALWMGAPDLPELHEAQAASARFMLHCLLLHGPLTREALVDLLPQPELSPLPESLLQRSLIFQQDGELQLTRRYIPHICRLLAEAGFPTGNI